MKHEIDRYKCDACGKVVELKHGQPVTELFFSYGWFATLTSDKGDKHACSRDCHKNLSNRMTGK